MITCKVRWTLPPSAQKRAMIGGVVTKDEAVQTSQGAAPWGIMGCLLAKIQERLCSPKKESNSEVRGRSTMCE